MALHFHHHQSFTDSAKSGKEETLSELAIGTDEVYWDFEKAIQDPQ
jgi:hypothetical protein